MFEKALNKVHFLKKGPTHHALLINAKKVDLIAEQTKKDQGKEKNWDVTFPKAAGSCYGYRKLSGIPPN